MVVSWWTVTFCVRAEKFEGVFQIPIRAFVPGSLANDVKYVRFTCAHIARSTF